MEIARYYIAEKNPEGAMLPGVPLRDLDVATFESFPEWLKQSIDASPMYRKTPVKDSGKKGAESTDNQ